MSTRYQNLSLHEESNINTTSNSSQVQQQSDLINAFGELDDEHTRLLISEPSSSLAVLPVSTDGVFSNISARPDCERVQEMPPTYQEAALDATPSYWQTTIITPTGMDDIVLVEGMPVDSVFAFVWNLMISASFQIIGFMLTYLLHTSHAAKQGSRAGFGISLIQIGFYTRSDEQNRENLMIIDVICYMLMLLGWFILLRSIADFLKAKQMEKIICAEPLPEV